MKTNGCFLLSFALAACSTLFVASPAYADGVSPPPATPAPSPTPSAPSPVKPPTTMWSKITVDWIKPTLTARNVYVIQGSHANEVSGGWNVQTAYAINKDTKVVQITVSASAPAGSRTKRNTERLRATVDVKELAGVVGKFDVVVVDRDGAELARTIYEKR